jgi:glutamate synthase (NADPH) large chain
MLKSEESFQVNRSDLNEDFAGISGLPAKQGLYDPKNEHDACGIGFVVNVKGIKSHEIIRQAITILKNLSHRGGCGSESNTGDGAGITIQLPHKFFMKVCGDISIKLPNEKEYGVGMVFLPTDNLLREKCEKRFEEIIKEEGQEFLGWRTLDTDNSTLGSISKSCQPLIKQIFIGKNSNLKDQLAFERKLYIIRKRAESHLRYSGVKGEEQFYITSLSSRTVIYKGMLTSEQLELFYKELTNPLIESSLALLHSRYSTNTFPSWERAHPYRYIIHNGEINTLIGNRNWMYARQSILKSDLFGEDLKKVFPIVNIDGSDSAMFDNAVEFLTLTGRSLPHAMMMMIPEPWAKHESMSEEKKAFYEFHAGLLEAWDGPAAMGFTDGEVIGATLDRNGLRPARYYVTKDDLVIMSSEVGVLDIEPERILYKERLRPGKMLLIDTISGRIINDDELKHNMATAHPYRQWLNENQITLEDLDDVPFAARYNNNISVLQKEKAFGYTYDDLRSTIVPMARDGVEPLTSMGIDTPLAVLSDKPQLLYNYFKQLFAQVTNPPIDALREKIVTSTVTFMGSEGSLLSTSPESCRLLKLNTPILNNYELEKIRNINKSNFKAVTIPILYKVADGGEGLERAMNELYETANNALKNGANLLILSDRDINDEYAGIPALLAVSGLHHHFIRETKRTQLSLIVESGEPCEIHQYALLLSYGASAINPYLAFEAIEDLIEQGMLTDIEKTKAIKNYIKSITKGILKIISKMGISTLQSYHGAHIFEAVGINKSVIDKYFTSTASRVSGIGLDTIADETKYRHDSAFADFAGDSALDSGGHFQWRKDGEYHLFNPETVHMLQTSCQFGNYRLFKDYTHLLNKQTQCLSTLRGLFELKILETPIPIDEVESVDSICKRFKTGAMSYGSISQEAHETLAVAMNRIGGKSNSGEGGEDPRRFKPLPNGDSLNSAIKQVASGRFGVTSEYLINADEIQIKMAQGAKPGEGGQLPGRKVYPWIAKTRHSTPGVGLISPPPHHDIYSIEDLAELIYNLKNANSRARINVKLVSEVGVGTIAAGVAKGRADVVLISGYDGGTGASPKSSIRHTGLPWELGVAETHQTLVLNNLRSKIVVETDGKLLTGRDVVIAALLGAEEYGFATAPLVVLGCVMMRVCNLDTCPVGVATQNPELRKNFLGKADHVVNFMQFIAQEMREIMSQLGFRTINEMIGRTDKIEMSKAIQSFKTKGVDLSWLLYKPDVPDSVGKYCTTTQDHHLEDTLDMRVLLKLCSPALEKGEKVNATLPIRNINRATSTMLGSEVTKRYGSKGLPTDTIKLNFEGSAGQSFGAFIPKGITLTLEGDSNDYVGKGLSGGKIIVYPPKTSTFIPEENIIIGNVAFYGATSGEAYIRGIAGERFCVRNSGINAVVEGVGDHGCEYMTGGRVVVLGNTGRNFAAGMSGGIAYVLDLEGAFKIQCNLGMVELDTINAEDEVDIKTMLKSHVQYTNSTIGKKVLDNWSTMSSKFVKIFPKDYKRMFKLIKKMQMAGLQGDDALMAAFEANMSDVARVSGN